MNKDCPICYKHDNIGTCPHYEGKLIKLSNNPICQDDAKEILRKYKELQESILALWDDGLVDNVEFTRKDGVISAGCDEVIEAIRRHLEARRNPAFR